MITGLSNLMFIVAEHVANIAGVVFTIVKFLLLLTFGYTFFIAIKTLLDFVSNLVASSVIGEVFGLISVYLPFNASAVFGSIFTVTAAIFAFLISRKVFNMYKELFAAAN